MRTNNPFYLSQIIGKIKSFHHYLFIHSRVHQKLLNQKEYECCGMYYQHKNDDEADKR